MDASGLVALPPGLLLSPSDAAGWLALGAGAAVLLGRLLWDLAASLSTMTQHTVRRVYQKRVRCMGQHHTALRVSSIIIHGHTGTAHADRPHKRQVWGAVHAAGHGRHPCQAAGVIFLCTLTKNPGRNACLWSCRPDALYNNASCRMQQLEAAPTDASPSEAYPPPSATPTVQDANSSNARALQTLRSATVVSSVLQDTRGLLKWVGLGSALLLTGNLAACLAGAAVQEAWVLVCIRVRYEAVVRVLKQQMAELRDSQREFDQLLR